MKFWTQWTIVEENEYLLSTNLLLWRKCSQAVVYLVEDNLAMWESPIVVYICVCVCVSLEGIETFWYLLGNIVFILNALGSLESHYTQGSRIACLYIEAKIAKIFSYMLSLFQSNIFCSLIGQLPYNYHKLLNKILDITILFPLCFHFVKFIRISLYFYKSIWKLIFFIIFLLFLLVPKIPVLFFSIFFHPSFFIFPKKIAFPWRRTGQRIIKAKMKIMYENLNTMGIYLGTLDFISFWLCDSQYISIVESIQFF